jgi:hypothetical protein
MYTKKREGINILKTTSGKLNEKQSSHLTYSGRSFSKQHLIKLCKYLYLCDSYIVLAIYMFK